MRALIRGARAVVLGAVCALSVAGTAGASAGYREVAVTSGSMRPAYQVGDALVVHLGATARTGDVIVFKRPGPVSMVAHRVVQVQLVGGERYYVTRGDANPTTDPQAVPQSQVYGRVVHRLPAVGRAMVAATSPQARLVLLALLILVVAPELVALCGPGAPVGRHRRHHRTGAGPRAAQPVTAVPSR